MTASEHTPHYHLSQFGPDDRPSWLDDYNQDMRIIDTALSDGNQDEPLFCTTQVRYSDNFTASMETPYRASFFAHDGNIDVDYNTHTIHITKSGYYAVSGYAEVYGVTPDSGNDKSLSLGIGKYYESFGYEFNVINNFNKSYEPIFNESGEPSEAHDWGTVQSCSITPVIAYFNAGDVVTMVIAPAEGVTTTLRGQISAMYLTVESKNLNNISEN